MTTNDTEWSTAANHSSNGVARGGALSIKDRKLIFTPHAFERMLDAASVQMSFDDIASVGTCDGKLALGELFSGGLRDRLSIKLKDGREELFVVSGLDDVVAAITAKLG